MFHGDLVQRLLPANWPIRYKLAAASLVFLVPIAFLLWVLFQQQGRELEAARRELAGIALLRQSRTLLERVLAQRDLAEGRQAGEGGRDAALEAGAEAIKKELQEIEPREALQRALPAGDLQRVREGIAALRQRWDGLHNLPGNDQAAAAGSAHLALVRELRQFTVLVADAAGLLSDPDPDSRPVAEAAFLAVPALQELLARSLEQDEEARARKTTRPEDRVEALALTRLLRTGLADLTDPIRGLSAAFRTASPDGQATQTALSELDQAAQAYLALLAGAADGAAVTPGELSASARTAQDAALRLRADASDLLAGRLKARADRIERNLLAALVGAGASVLLGLMLLALSQRGLTRQLRSLGSLFAEIDAGNYQARAEVLSQDELGQVAGSLNATLDNMVGLIQSREERDRIQASITKLLQEISGVAEGDLTKEAEVTADVTGAIADSFNFMIEQLRRVIKNVQEATQQVNAAANQIHDRAEELVDGSEQQARQIGNTSSSVEEMAGSIRGVAENANRSAQVAEQALASARQGAQAVHDTIGGMNRIRNQVQETAKRIKRLGESSQQIGEIVQLIDDIADRTSILALNAAIQAATAGEAGRGFAVVAGEVERLAERSASATKKIATLVRTIQGETGEAISAMEEGTREVVEGSRLANQAGQALARIEEVSTKLAALIQSISESSRQQAQASQNISQAMNSIFQITQQTADGTREAARSVDHLAALADDLRDSVSTFRLPDSLPRGPISPSNMLGNGLRDRGPSGPLLTDELDEEDALAPG